MFMRKKVFCFAMIVSMLCPLAPIPVFADAAPAGEWTRYAARNFSEGDGTSASPYQIDTPEELSLLALTGLTETFRDKHFILTADLDLSEHFWTPIRFRPSDWDAPMSTFDGNGHTISGLHVKTYDTWDGWFSTGLFSTVYRLSISGLTLESPVISPDKVGKYVAETADMSDYYIAPLVAYAWGHTFISNCHVRNPRIEIMAPEAVKGQVFTYIGGLLGIGEGDVLVADCSVSGGSLHADTVTGFPGLRVGGLAGAIMGDQLRQSGFLLNSFAQTEIGVISNYDPKYDNDGATYSFIDAGGLVGFDNGFCILNCYSASNLTVAIEKSPACRTAYAVGGIVGNTIPRSILNNYFCGDIQVTANDDAMLSGMAGECLGEGEPSILSVRNNYYAENSSYPGIGDYANEQQISWAAIPISQLEGENKQAALTLMLNTNLYLVNDSINVHYESYLERFAPLLKKIPVSCTAMHWGILSGENNGYPQHGLESGWPFIDIKESVWYYEAVKHVFENNILNGVSDSRFSPDELLSRAMMATLLWRMEGEPEPAADARFTDVPEGTWYSKPVAWASEQGIILGLGNERFAPNDILTREQMASMLCRYADFSGYATTLTESHLHYYDSFGFKDENSVSGWALQPVQWAVSSGILSGRSSGTLAPQESCTRAEAAAFILKYQKYMDAQDTLYKWDPK